MWLKYRRDAMLFLFMLICVSLAGELKFHPFGGYFSGFQVSLGSPVFLLFILFIHNISLVFTGTCMGIFVVIFRAFIDVYSLGEPFTKAIWLHAATFFYYFVYAGCFLFPKFDRTYMYNKAVQIAVWSIFAEIAASIAELSATNILVNSSWHVLTLAMIFKLMCIAVLRCLFILSFFFLAQLYVMETRMYHEHEENKRMLLLITGLYNEVVQLNTSQRNAEDATRKCYKIYKELELQASTVKEKTLAAKVLAMAGILHEIKKDNQRIYAGLVALTDKHNSKMADYLPANKIMQLSIEIHRKYAKSLGKSIEFRIKISGRLPLLHVYTMLSFMNNLISNAVEAINKNGTIDLLLYRDGDILKIFVTNTGSFIPKKRLELIFQPGYTTKFDSNGNASTGVGLSYVKNHVESLGGSINIDSDGANNVICALFVPLSKLERT